MGWGVGEWVCGGGDLGGPGRVVVLGVGGGRRSWGVLLGGGEGFDVGIG